jgi:hypothetical protein
MLTDAARSTMLDLVQRACHVVTPSPYSVSSSRRGMGVGFSAGRTSIATKIRYAFGIPRQGFQRRRIPDAMPQRQHTSC